MARLGHILLVTSTLVAGCGRTTKHAQLPCHVDLTYTYDEDTVYWPTSPSKFEKETLSYGMTDQGFFYSAYSIATPEHGGTHIDAPIHFAKGQATTEAIPLDRLIGSAIVIDMTSDAENDPDAMLLAKHILEFERDHGEIDPGTIILVRTGWATRWPDPAAYLGTAERGSASNLHFPGLSPEAARLLRDRKVAAVGIDTASIDPGPSQDFMAHRILMEAGVPAFENVASLEGLPASGFRVFALPMKIGGGSGGPLRIVAELDADECKGRP